jgi:hypothetical protein
VPFTSLLGKHPVEEMLGQNHALYIPAFTNIIMCKTAGPKLCPLFTSLRNIMWKNVGPNAPCPKRALPYTSQGDLIDGLDFCEPQSKLVENAKFSKFIYKFI